MDNYRPNSHKAKEEQRESISEKKIEKVIAGTAKSKKKNEIQKVADLFLPEDVSSVKSYIIFDVIVPLIKKALFDTVEAIIYPEGRSNRNAAGSKVSYNRYYDKPNDRGRDNNATRTRNGYSYDDIVLDSRGEVEEVLSNMDELISKYGLVSVADLNDLVGRTGQYTDNKYGWTDIRGASPVRLQDGFLIKLPKALPLN